MDMTPHIPALARSREQVQGLMAQTTTIACFGSRALLSLFICAAPEPAQLLAAVTTEEEALQQLLRHRPGFLFVTEQLEAGDGLSLVRRAHAMQPELRTLLILQSGSPERLQLALDLGCNGVVVEQQLAKGAMVEAIRAVIGGGIYADQPAVQALRASRRGDGPEPLEALTSREREVLSLLTQGCTNREIAETLIVSSETVKTHLGNILSKLHARDRTHAAVIGLRRGLVAAS
ncbi:MAG: LuxR C-terminal-related transcriptional regulator [Cyanobium sp.]